MKPFSEKSLFCVPGPSWKAPVFRARMLRFSEHQPRMEVPLNTEYKSNLWSRPDFNAVYIQAEKWYSKNHFVLFKDDEHL
jgi:hypothetical protein